MTGAYNDDMDSETLARARDLSYFIDSMKLKQTVLLMCLVMSLAVGVTATFMQPVRAADDCSDERYRKTSPGNCCGTINVSIIGGTVCDGMDNNNKDPKTSTQTNGVWKLLIFALNIMTAGVGILGVAGIVYGSVLYTTASDKAEQTKKAIGVITNVVIGIVAYGLMYIGLNFLIPGGIFT